jgi:transcriptional regulator with XRE-family HTH domain
VIGDRVRQLRSLRGLTLAQLASDRLSISMVSKIERGLVRPSLPTLEYLAERLGTTAAELMGAGAEGPSGTEVAHGAAALANDDPDEALVAVDGVPGEAASVVRAQALLALGRDDEALALADDALRWAPLTGRSGEVAALHLVRAETLARAGRGEQAQAAFGRALERAPEDAFDVRAAALIGLADAAERAGSRSTARNFLRQAQAPLAQAASPSRRAAALRRRAASAEPRQTGALLAAAAELAALARAATLRAETAARLAHLEPDVLPSTAFREASDQVAHRSIRRDRGG